MQPEIGEVMVGVPLAGVAVVADHEGAVEDVVQEGTSMGSGPGLVSNAQFSKLIKMAVAAADTAPGVLSGQPES